MASFGVLAYRDTDNLGDEIQSLAALARLPPVSFFFDRDRLSEVSVPGDERVSVLMSGWFCHYPELWPPSTAIRPLFISMHITQERANSTLGLVPSEYLLTPPISEYLRRHAPIGARDPATCELLQRAGIEAYFSGSIAFLFERPPVGRSDDLIVLNDLPPDIVRALRANTQKHVFRTTHAGFQNVDREERFLRAQELLELYARASCVVTTRLHCALPCLAIGTPVLLLDVAGQRYRFDGLNDFVHHCTEAAYLSGHFQYDIDNPPDNPALHLPYRERMVARIERFVSEADTDEQGCPSSQRTTENRLATLLELYRRKGLPQPRWTASVGNFVTTSTQEASALPPEARVLAESGSVLSGTVLGEVEGHFSANEVFLNGTALPPYTWYFSKNAWQAIEIELQPMPPASSANRGVSSTSHTIAPAPLATFEPSSRGELMKWYMALNEAGTTGDLARHTRLAVLSARANSNLRPHMLYYGERNPFTRWLEDNGVKVIDSQPTFIEAINKLVKEQRYSTSFIGHWLRTNVCLEERESEYILYTDVDVVLCSRPELADLCPSFLAAAPEFDNTAWNYFNAGSMVTNVPALRSDFAAFERYIVANLEEKTYNFHDQIAYNVFYRDRWDKLPLELNWKPYWGHNDAVQLLHFHGPKFGAIASILQGNWDWSSHSGRQVGSLFASHVDEYQHYLRMCLVSAPDLMAEDQDAIATLIHLIEVNRERLTAMEVDLSFTKFRMFDVDRFPSEPDSGLNGKAL